MTPIWTPSHEVVEAANTTRFARAHGLAGHAELLRRSVEDPEWFWDAVVGSTLEFSGMRLRNAIAPSATQPRADQ